MTLNELVFAVLDTVRPDNLTNSSISEELVKFHIKNTRAELIKQGANKGYTIDSYVIQSLGCIDLEEVDASECCEVPSGCKILRTNVSIPTPIKMHSRQLITRVGPVNRLEKSWQQIEFERVPFETPTRFTKNMIKWFTMNNNGRVYILVPADNMILRSIDICTIDGVWSDPEDLVTFHNCDTGEACFSGKSEFPCSEDMANTILKIVINEFVAKQNTQPIDVTNDNKTNLDTTVNKGI